MKYTRESLNTLLAQRRMHPAGIRVEVVSVYATTPEDNGADLLSVGYCEGERFNWVSGYKPHANANEEILRRADDLRARVSDTTPLLTGVCAFDPFTTHELLLEQVQEKGFAGIQNFPTIGLCGGYFRANLERVGITFAQDTALIQKAHAMDMFTLPFVFQASEARQMLEAGADGIVVHLGLNEAMETRQCATVLREVNEALGIERSRVFLLCCGAPLQASEDPLSLRPLVDGFYGLATTGED